MHLSCGTRILGLAARFEHFFLTRNQRSCIYIHSFGMRSKAGNAGNKKIAYEMFKLMLHNVHEQRGTIYLLSYVTVNAIMNKCLKYTKLPIGPKTEKHRMQKDKINC